MSTAVKKEHKSNRPARGGVATFVEAIRQGIWEEMERDPTVFVIGEDVGAYGGAFKVTDGLIEEFGWIFAHNSHTRKQGGHAPSRHPRTR